jgi:hypothetical protein
LEVGIYNSDDVAGRMTETGGDGGLMAEVPRKSDHADTRVGGGNLSEDCRAPILAAIVDIHDLKGDILLLSERFADARMGKPNDLLLIEERDDDREKRLT